MTAYFVSDLHLVNIEDERSQIFLRFLQRLKAEKECTHLFLLGDVFDFWVGDHSYFVHSFAPIVEALRHLQVEGVEIHYFEGNHDLHLRKFWQEQVGFKVHGDSYHLTLAGWRLRLEHGDQMDPSDRGYLFLRWLLRTPVMTWLAYHCPGGILAQIGKRASEQSRRYTSGPSKSQSDELAKEKMKVHACRVYKVKPFDALIAGHMHVAEDREVKLPEGHFRLMNLGSWMESPRALQLVAQAGSPGNQSLGSFQWIACS